ncbi:MAG: hypothetical protein R3C30_14235 [Hyphomonadaceae bacterium]
MNLRAAVLAFALIAAAVAPTHAQVNEGAPREAAPVATLSPEQVAAGENLFRAIVFDGGAVDRIFEHMEAEVIPELRSDIISSPLYREASPDRREALMQVIDNLPVFMRQELTAGLVTIGASAAPRFAERMSAEHLNATAEFMRSPEMRVRWRAIVEDRIDLDKPMPSFPDWRDVGDFAQTPAGQAFAEQQEALGDILDEESERTLAIVFPRMLAGLSGQMCDALGSDCPDHIRDAAGRI